MGQYDVLLNKITDEAVTVFGDDVCKDNYDKYVVVWFETAERIKNEMLEEGLNTTANEVERIINFYKKLYK